MTSTLIITAAYVWQCASDFRANRDIADSTSLHAHDTSITVNCAHDDIASLTAAMEMLDVTEVDQHPGEWRPGHTIISVRGTYRGVYTTAQAAFTVPDAASAALRAGGR